jgi:hypothetical protein
MSKTVMLGLGIGTGAILLVFAVLLVGLLVLKLLWAWIVPDLFPGAVEQGLIAGEISWWMSFKMAIVLAVLSIFWGRSSS